MRGEEMKETVRYREYAAECLRMAKKASEKDRDVLLNMADAWQLRAEAAERSRSDETPQNNDCVFGAA
jgi:hypothetical protein